MEKRFPVYIRTRSSKATLMIILAVLQVSIKSIPELAMMSVTYLSVSVSLCFFFGGSRKRGKAAEVFQKYYQEIILVNKYTFLG